MLATATHAARASSGGVTTPNSKFPRTELAEVQTWKMPDGTSTLAGTLSIDKLPPNGEIVIGQIHQKAPDGGKPRPPVELIYRNGDLILSVMDSNSPDAKRTEIKIAENVGVGEPSPTASSWARTARWT